MKSRRLILILLLVNFMTLNAQKEKFDDANHLMDSSNYEQAIIKYKHLEEDGNVSANLYYNLANAYYETKQIGNSILYFEKAKKLDPSNRDIENNLRLAYLATENQIEPLPQLFFVKWWYTLLSRNNASQWSKKAACFAWISFFLFALYLFLKKRFLVKLGILSALITVSLVFLAANKHQFDYQHNYAILMKKEAQLRENPHDDSDVILNASEGLKVEITDSVDAWTKIKLEDGKEAWLPSLYLEKI